MTARSSLWKKKDKNAQKEAKEIEKKETRKSETELKAMRSLKRTKNTTWSYNKEWATIIINRKTIIEMRISTTISNYSTFSTFNIINFLLFLPKMEERSET